VGLLLSGVGAPETQDMEKSEVQNAFFASVLTSKARLQATQAQEPMGKGWKEDVPLVEEDQVREHFSKLDVQS